MHKHYKMIVLDLDGTILDDSRYITKTTETYLKKLKQEGYIITIATGRPYDLAKEATYGLTFANYLITNTGAYLYDLETGKRLYKSNLRKSIIRKIQKKFKDRLDLKYLYTEKMPYKDTPIYKVRKITQAVFSSKYDLNEIYKEIKQEPYKINVIIMQDSFSTKKWLEIQPPNSTKYNTIARLAEMLNIDNDDIIAFGDGLNDTEMLSKCGHGVALQNALPEVKKSANDVTKEDNNNDGVIKYLDTFLKDK